MVSECSRCERSLPHGPWKQQPCHGTAFCKCFLLRQHEGPLGPAPGRRRGGGTPPFSKAGKPSSGPHVQVSKGPASSEHAVQRRDKCSIPERLPGLTGSRQYCSTPSSWHAGSRRRCSALPLKGKKGPRALWGEN